MSEPEQPEPQKISMPMDADIPHLGVLSIQIHEIFLNLKRAGFSHRDALHLAGMVLAYGTLTAEDSEFEDEFNEEDETYEEDEEDFD